MSFQIPSTAGARFYNLPDRATWMEQMKLVKTDRQEPSVTTKLSVWPKGRRYYKWLADQKDLAAAEDARDEGGLRGSRVHEVVENMKYGDKYGFEAYADKYFRGDHEAAVHEWQRISAYVEWYADYGQPTVVDRRSGIPAIECELYSWEHGYGGTTDTVYTGGKFGNMRVMVDYKTSIDIYLSFWAQLAAYDKAWSEMGEIPVDAIATLKLSCDSAGRPKYTFKMIEGRKEIDEYFLDFLASARLWERYREYEKLSTTERKVHHVEELLSIPKLAERPPKEQAAWEAPKDLVPAAPVEKKEEPKKKTYDEMDMNPSTIAVL